MNSITGAEIFDTGTWNGIPFTTDDLDGIVSAFNALKLAGKVPLKFGHAAAPQRSDGEPALGWVSKIYRKGSKLLADFSDVADTVVQSIRSGAYRFASVELLKNVMAGSRSIPWVLDAVALLGAAPPAVGTLSPIKASRAPLNFDELVSFTRQETDDDMTTKEQFAALTKRHVALLFESAVREGRILPRDREQFTRRYPEASAEDAEAFIRDTPKPPKSSDRVSLGGGTVVTHGGRADFRLAEAVHTFIRERRQAGEPLPGQTFEQLLAAAKEIFKRDPDLAKAWQDAPGER